MDHQEWKVFAAMSFSPRPACTLACSHRQITLFFFCPFPHERGQRNTTDDTLQTDTFLWRYLHVCISRTAGGSVSSNTEPPLDLRLVRQRHSRWPEDHHTKWSYCGTPNGVDGDDALSKPVASFNEHLLLSNEQSAEEFLKEFLRN